MQTQMWRYKSKIFFSKDSNQYCSQSAFFLYVEQRSHATLKTPAESTEMMNTNLWISDPKPVFLATKTFDKNHQLFVQIVWVYLEDTGLASDVSIMITHSMTKSVSQDLWISSVQS